MSAYFFFTSNRSAYVFHSNLGTPRGYFFYCGHSTVEYFTMFICVFRLYSVCTMHAEPFSEQVLMYVSSTTILVCLFSTTKIMSSQVWACNDPGYQPHHSEVRSATFELDARRRHMHGTRREAVWQTARWMLLSGKKMTKPTRIEIFFLRYLNTLTSNTKIKVVSNWLPRNHP